jgi:hypothetical protein
MGVFKFFGFDFGIVIIHIPPPGVTLVKSKGPLAERVAAEVEPYLAKEVPKLYYFLPGIYSSEWSKNKTWPPSAPDKKAFVTYGRVGEFPITGRVFVDLPLCELTYQVTQIVSFGAMGGIFADAKAPPPAIQQPRTSKIPITLGDWNLRAKLVNGVLSFTLEPRDEK